MNGNRKLNINNAFIISIILLAIGLISLCVDLSNIHKLKRSYNLNDINFEDIESGIYISGEIDHLLGVYVESVGNDRFFGVASEISLGYGTYYQLFTIPFTEEDNKYITYLSPSNDSKEIEQLSDMVGNQKMNICGKVIKLPCSLNYKWLQDALHVSTLEDIDKFVSDKYAIMPIDYDEVMNKWMKDVCIIVLAIIIFVCFSDFRNIIEQK